MQNMHKENAYFLIHKNWKL